MLVHVTADDEEMERIMVEYSLIDAGSIVDIQVVSSIISNERPSHKKTTGRYKEQLTPFLTREWAHAQSTSYRDVG